MSESETICCELFKYKPQTQSQLEETFDDNDNDILFMNKEGEKLHETPLVFSCYSYRLANDCFLLRKVNYDEDISIVLTYKKEGDKRILLAGHLISNNEKYDVIDFNVYTDMHVNGKLYESIAICFYNGLIN
jgi:hypothetical protein